MLTGVDLARTYPPTSVKPFWGYISLLPCKNINSSDCVLKPV